MDKNQIDNLAELSRIEISEDEKKELGEEIQSILDYVGQIQEVAAEDSVHEAGENRNVMRDDTDPYPKGVLTERLLKEAPNTQDGYVKVKKIL